MNMENRSRFDTIEYDLRNRDVFSRDESLNDDIGLGELIVKVAEEWKAMALVLLLGLLGTLATIYLMPRTYTVESVLRVPSLAEMGELGKQRLLEVGPQQGFQRVLNQLFLHKVHESTFENSEWFKGKGEVDENTIAQTTQNLRKQISVRRVIHDHYDLKKGEKVPLSEIVVSLKSSEPEYAADYVQRLIAQAHESALSEILKDIGTIKQNRISMLEERLFNLSRAAKKNREAEISRLLESNQKKIAELEQQIELKISKAIRERDNRLVLIQEALAAAERLQLKEPITWDDLRPARESAQVVNELGGKDDTPLYFWGTRLLNTELQRLRQRDDIKPFVPGLVDLENQLLQIRNDTEISALKKRSDDSIYIEQYDELQRELIDLREQDTGMRNFRLAVVTQPPIVPVAPTRSSLFILLAGMIASGFIALLVVLVRILTRNSEQKSTLRAIAE